MCHHRWHVWIRINYLHCQLIYPGVDDQVIYHFAAVRIKDDSELSVLHHRWYKFQALDVTAAIFNQFVYGVDGLLAGTTQFNQGAGDRQGKLLFFVVQAPEFRAKLQVRFAFKRWVSAARDLFSKVESFSFIGRNKRELGRFGEISISAAL